MLCFLIINRITNTKLLDIKWIDYESKQTTLDYFVNFKYLLTVIAIRNLEMWPLYLFNLNSSKIYKFKCHIWLNLFSIKHFLWVNFKKRVNQSFWGFNYLFFRGENISDLQNTFCQTCVQWPLDDNGNPKLCPNQIK